MKMYELRSLTDNDFKGFFKSKRECKKFMKEYPDNYVMHKLILKRWEWSNK